MITYMNYLNDTEQALRRVIDTTPAGQRADVIVRFVKEKLIESYKNGLQAGKVRAERHGNRASEACSVNK